MGWRSTKIDNEGHDQKTNNCNDLDTGENELGLSINRNREDVERDDEKNNK